MAVLALVRIKGDAGQLAASIHQHMNPVMNRIAVENGVLSHTLCRPRRAGWSRMYGTRPTALGAPMRDQEVQQALERAGLTNSRDDMYEVDDHRSFQI